MTDADLDALIAKSLAAAPNTCRESRLRDAITALRAENARLREAEAGVSLTFEEFAKAAKKRQAEWMRGTSSEGFSLSFRGNELAGEVGEACNIIKKLERERLGAVGSRASVSDLGDELADVIICVQNIASDAGLDLEAALIRKFNATSAKLGFNTMLDAPAIKAALEVES